MLIHTLTVVSVMCCHAALPFYGPVACPGDRSNSHTLPCEWAEPRVIHTPISEDSLGSIDLLYQDKCEESNRKVFSPNGAYFFVMDYAPSPDDYARWECTCHVVADRDYALLLTLPGPRYESADDARWINEKLLHFRYWTGRMRGIDMILDVEAEKTIYLEHLHWGSIDYEQWMQGIQLFGHSCVPEDPGELPLLLPQTHILDNAKMWVYPLVAHKWTKPRVLQRPIDEEFYNLATLRRVPRREPSAEKVCSDNDAYWFSTRVSERKETDRHETWTLTVDNEKPYLLELELQHVDYRYEKRFEWINEKLIYARWWYGRVLGADLILDVEHEQILNFEHVHDGLIAYQQAQEALSFGMLPPVEASFDQRDKDGK